MDYFGHFSVINGRKAEKRYEVIFTCMSSRAIHLEISYSLSTDSFINALRRFVSRRGNVESITIDNGTNFLGSNRELGVSIEAWNLKLIKDLLLQQSIQWNFNPPYATHFGGFFEREFCSVRKILNSVLTSQLIKLNDENLMIIFCEIESVLNYRPLTELSSDLTLTSVMRNNL